MNLLSRLRKYNFPTQWNWWIGEIDGKEKETLSVLHVLRLASCISVVQMRRVPKHTATLSTAFQIRKVVAYPLKKADGPSLVNIVIAQLGTLGYCPGVELTNLVFTTSTGEDRTVVQNPAITADTTWHGTSSKTGQQNQATSDIWEGLLVFSCPYKPVDNRRSPWMSSK